MKHLTCLIFIHVFASIGFAQTHTLVENYLASKTMDAADPYAGIPFFDTKEHNRGFDFEQRDSTNSYSWEAASQSYRHTTHSVYYYTPNTIVRLGYSSSYELGYRDSTIYDDSGRELDYYYSIWLGTGWWEFLHFAYQYDDQGNLIEFVHREDNGGGLKNIGRTVYSYNSEGLLEERLDHDWLSGFKDWGNDRRQTFSYDTNNLLTTTVGERWINDAYQLLSRITNSYGLENELLMTQTEVWRNNAWELRGQVLFAYDGILQLVEQETQEYDSGYWVPLTKTLIGYDVSGNQTSFVHQRYDSTSWVYETRALYTFTEANNLISEVYQDWDSTWIPFDSLVHYYSIIASVADRPLPEGLTIYPNPCSDVLYVKESDQAWNSYEIVDMHTGHILKQSFTKGNIHVDGMLPGMYVLRVRNKEQVVAQQRFIKM